MFLVFVDLMVFSWLSTSYLVSVAPGYQFGLLSLDQLMAWSLPTG